MSNLNFYTMKNLGLLFKKSDKSGLTWYKEAHEFCVRVADKYSLPLNKVCGVVSALSPGSNWEQNKRDSINLIESFSGSERKFKFATYGKNVVKALKILRESDSPETFFSLKTGAKTYNFYFNLLNPEGTKHVTIDRHAYTIATGEVYKGLTPNVYETVADHYRKAAKALDITPAQLQAVLWVDYRIQQDIKFAVYVPF